MKSSLVWPAPKREHELSGRFAQFWAPCFPPFVSTRHELARCWRAPCAITRVYVCVNSNQGEGLFESNIFPASRDGVQFESDFSPGVGSGFKQGGIWISFKKMPEEGTQFESELDSNNPPPPFEFELNSNWVLLCVYLGWQVYLAFKCHMLLKTLVSCSLLHKAALLETERPVDVEWSPCTRKDMFSSGHCTLSLLLCA